MIYLFWTLLFFLIVILITVYWQPLFPTWLRKQLERELSERLPLQVSIHKARYRFLSFLLIIDELEAIGEQGEVIRAQKIVIKDPISFLWRGAILSAEVKELFIEKSALCIQLFQKQGLKNAQEAKPMAPPTAALVSNDAPPIPNPVTAPTLLASPKDLDDDEAIADQLDWELKLESMILDWPLEGFEEFPKIKVESVALSGGSAGLKLEELTLECDEELSLSLVDDLGGSGQLGLALSLQRPFLDRLSARYQSPWRPVEDGELVLSGRFEFDEVGAQVHQAKVQWGALQAEGRGQARFEDSAFALRLKTELAPELVARLNEGLTEDKRAKPEHLARLPESPLSLSAQFSNLQSKNEGFFRISWDQSRFEANAFTDKEFWPLQASGEMSVADLCRFLDLSNDSVAFLGDAIRSHWTLWQDPEWRCEGVLTSPLFEIQVNPEASPTCFSFKDCSLKVALDDKELNWSEVKASFLGGQLDKGEGRLQLQSEKQTYEGTIDFKDLTVEDWPTGSEDGLSSILEGKGRGWFEYRGHLDDGDSFAGDGSLTVEDPHYKFLNDIRSWAKNFGLPLPHERGVKEATGTIIWTEGGFRIEDIEAPLVGVKIHGHWGFDREERVDALFKIEVSRTYLRRSPLLILPAFMTGAMGFDVVGTGTLSEPVFQADLKILDKLLGKGPGESGFIGRLLKGFE